MRGVWETAARTNPMLLAKLRPDYQFSRLRQLLKDCIAQGHTKIEARERVLKELLHSASTSDQPSDNCDRLASHTK